MAWKKPCQKPPSSAGCRHSVNALYPAETGLGDMPPVEQAIASWTALGPAQVSANLRCPRKECAKTDHLLSHSFNAAACAACVGNALAILLAALQKKSAEDQDSKALVNSALLAHSQLTSQTNLAFARCHKNATNPQRRPQPQGGGQQKSSGRGAGHNGGPA